MKVKTNLPLNLADEHVYLFKGKEMYSLKELRIRKLKNVFVNHWGVVLKRLLIPLRSAENLIGLYDQSFYWQHWRKVLEQYIVCKFGKSLPSVQLNDANEYYSIHTPWFGYFSWLTTHLPKLLAVSEKFPNAILLVPEGWDKEVFVKDTLEMFPQIKKEIIPEDHHVFVKNFILAENRPWTSVFYPEQLKQVRVLFFSNISQVKLTPIKRIYVSRKQAKRRIIVNETDLVNCLRQFDFEEICFEDYSIFEQVYLMKHAECLVSMHGAGLTNAMFMSPKSSVLEISPVIENKDLFRFPFWRISSILEIDYYIQFASTINNHEDDFYSRNIEVDIEQLKKNIDLMIHKIS